MRWPWKREDSELDLELRYHLEAMADAFEAEGMTRAEAMRRARREFGGVERVKDECRDESRWRWVLEVGQDLRFGWRMMKKTPAISMAAVSGASEPWTEFSPTDRAKSLRIVPASALAGFVAPMMSRYFLMAPSPSRTCTTTGPAVIVSTSSPKKGRSRCTP